MQCITDPEPKKISGPYIAPATTVGIGSEGDERRRRGWSAIILGPLTAAIVERFMIKLSKALYFKLNGHVFDGVLDTHQIDRLRADKCNLIGKHSNPQRPP